MKDHPSDVLAAYAASFDDAPPPLEPEGAGQPPGDDRPALAKLLLSRSALNELPNPEPLIADVLDKGTVALLYGMWGTGKSFIALDWAASVATGRTWQSRPCQSARILYVAAEGAFGLKARLDAWETGWQRTIADATFDVLPQPVNLTHYGQVNALAALVEWNRYGLVVVDTLARCMVGADENSARDCGVVVDALTRIREHTPGGRGVVLGIHHSGKDGRTFRGSSAFEAGADTVYSVARDAENGSIILNREKRKDGPQLDIHTLKLDPIPGTGSVTIAASHPLRHEHRSDALLSHFASHFADTGATATQLRETSELQRATFYRALNDLVNRGDLLNTGTDQRPFYKLADK